MACSHSAASTSPFHPSASISRTFRRFPIFQTAPIPSGVPPKLLQRRPLFLSLLCHSPTPWRSSATSRVSTASIVTATFRIPRSFRQKDESMTRQYVKGLLHQESVCECAHTYLLRLSYYTRWSVDSSSNDRISRRTMVGIDAEKRSFPSALLQWSRSVIEEGATK